MDYCDRVAFRRIERIFIHFQDRYDDAERHALVAIDKGMIAKDTVGNDGGHFEQAGIVAVGNQVFGSSQGRFKATQIAHAGFPAKFFKVFPVSLKQRLDWRQCVGAHFANAANTPL